MAELRRCSRAVRQLGLVFAPPVVGLVKCDVSSGSVRLCKREKAGVGA